MGKSPGLFGDLKDIKEIHRRLANVEATLKKVLRAVTPPKARPQNRTRLLFPFVSSSTGFDTGISVANTGKDSSGVVGKAGICTFHYFGRAGGQPPVKASESTDREIAAGETIALSLSSGGSLGLKGNPNFQGYVEVECDFPFAHGYAVLTDEPFGAARTGMSIPALVLPLTRTNSREESAGQ